jgi:hypothetical protein
MHSFLCKYASPATLITFRLTPCLIRGTAPSSRENGYGAFSTLNMMRLSLWLNMKFCLNAPEQTRDTLEWAARSMHRRIDTESRRSSSMPAEHWKCKNGPTEELMEGVKRDWTREAVHTKLDAYKLRKWMARNHSYRVGMAMRSYENDIMEVE